MFENIFGTTPDLFLTMVLFMIGWGISLCLLHYTGSAQITIICILGTIIACCLYFFYPFANNSSDIYDRQYAPPCGGNCIYVVPIEPIAIYPLSEPSSRYVEGFSYYDCYDEWSIEKPTQFIHEPLWYDDIFRNFD